MVVVEEVTVEETTEGPPPQLHASELEATEEVVVVEETTVDETTEEPCQHASDALDETTEEPCQHASDALEATPIDETTEGPCQHASEELEAISRCRGGRGGASPRRVSGRRGPPICVASSSKTDDVASPPALCSVAIGAGG